MEIILEQHKSNRVLLTVVVIFLTLLLFFFMIVFFWSWPDKQPLESDSFFLRISADKRLLIFALSAAGIGSILGTLRSFVIFGSQLFKSEWMMFYLFKPVIGMLTGLFVYITIRGGIIKVDQPVDVLNPYAIASIVAIAGFLSELVIARVIKSGVKLLGNEDIKLEKKVE